MKRVIVMMLAALTTFGTGLQASDKYGSGKQFAESLKGNGSGVLNNFKPGEVIPGYTENPLESAHYGGVTSSNSASLESAGASALNTSEVGKLTSEVIMNRPKDPISMDAPFISGGFDVQDKADIVTNGMYDKCETVNVSKTEITSHVCERTPAAELTCIRKAHIGGKYEESWHTQWLEYEMNQLPSSEVNGQYVVSIPSPVTGEIISAHYSWKRIYIQKSDNMVITVLGSRLNWNSKTSVDASFTPEQKTLTAGVPFTSSHPTRAGSIRFKRHTSMKLRLQVKVKTETWKPVVEWTESCPFNKAEEVLQGSQCTEAGGNRVISMGGKEYTVYSDCWVWKDTYLKQEADNGSCDVYMKNPACTASRVNCQEKSGSACLQEEVTFSCEKKVTGEAQLCSGQLVCANGECDAIENGTSDGFGKAVSALAAVTAAAQDVAAMNDVNVRAFTGKPVECRMAIAGFNNCCKDSGWGQGIGLAHCDSEEKALGKAKEKLLTVYVGTYCSKKALGVCLQKKKAYCQFDSKLAQIVQAQGRKGQLGIGFGSGKHPDCRGITVEELQSLKFDRMDFSNFYSDLNAGTTIPSDSELAERVKEQVASALQQSTGKGQ